MLQEVQSHFGLARPLYGAGIFEAEHHRQILREVPAAVMTGRIAVISSLVGSGKTVLLRRIEEELARQKVVVAQSLAVDKERTTLATLIEALFYDLSSEKEVKIPKHGEKRERELRELVRKQRRPIVLIVDEAHDLHANTLKGLKRLMEVVANGGGTLSIVLSGHPRLRNDLRQPRLEEVGYRMTIFEFEGIAGHQREYIDWLLRACAAEGTAVSDMIEEAAIEFACRAAAHAAVDRAAPYLGLRRGLPPRRQAGAGRNRRGGAQPPNRRPRTDPDPPRLRRPHPRRPVQCEAGRDQGVPRRHPSSRPHPRADRDHESRRHPGMIPRDINEMRRHMAQLQIIRARPDDCEQKRRIASTGSHNVSIALAHSHRL
jgi:type II secretory pathway predicted ATPase ExeA